MPTFYVLKGPDKGLTFEATEDPLLIGRYSDQIALTDDSISRKHAELASRQGEWILKDLHSSNGTYVNGRRIFSPTRLQHNDHVKVGATILVFHQDDSVGRVSGQQRIRDLVDLDIGSSQSKDAAILSSIIASEESVILQPPETADQIAAWNVVYRIAEIIGSVLRIEDFLGRVTDIVFEYLVVDRLVILMLDRATGELTPEVVRYRTKNPNNRPKINTSRTIINHVIESGAGVLCADAMSDARFTDESKQDSIHQLGLRSVLCVPIVAHEEVQGVVHLDCSMSHHTYTQEQLRLATVIGRMIGLAIENARLLESRMKHERLAATGQTVTHLSHEMRNILQGLRGGADVVEMGLNRTNMEMVREGWKIVKRGLDRAFVLATNMLSFSKKPQPRIGLVQLDKIVNEALLNVQLQAREKHVKLTRRFEENMPPVPVDEHGLQQVFLNLLLNAVDAVEPRKGRVEVATAYDETTHEAKVSVIDNGPGIPPEEHHRIFEPFVSSKGQAGTGLGLAVARKIVKELNGRIELQSAPGQGAAFTVILTTHHETVTDGDKTHGPDKPS